MLGAQDSKTSHCGCVAVITWMVRGRRYARRPASAARLMHVGFTATPAATLARSGCYWLLWPKLASICTS